jgi:site-specific DNA-methyltransferase (adenine-specific)
MRQLVKICTPGGTILDPFAGSGSTGVAALAEGYSFTGIEQSAEYAAIARERLDEAQGA